MLAGTIIASFLGPGRLFEAPVNTDVKIAYSGEVLVPIGVNGTTVTVIWDFFVRTQPPSRRAECRFSMA
jgi:hypothetical protein